MNLRDPGEGFLNPYGFVSIPDRSQLPSELADLRAAKLPGHDWYDEKRWSGDIPITITTVTPMLIPDPWGAARNDSGSGVPPALPVRIDGEGRPLLSASAVKGMLRSAYEVITNSRFGVFAGHAERLALRANADRNIGERLRPGVVVADGKGGTRIRWVDSFVPAGWKPEATPSPAVWVPRELAAKFDDRAEVEAWVQVFQHRPPRQFYLWRALDVAAPGELPAKPSAPRESKLNPINGFRDPVRVRGLLHKTGSRFPADKRNDRKHDERLVLTTSPDKAKAKVEFRTAPADKDVIEAWGLLIKSYGEAHARESVRDLRENYGTYVWKPGDWSLTTGRTLHVELDGQRIIGLYPAMISRKLFPGPPAASLPQGHQPATERAELSPADRVFGWVRGANRSASQREADADTDAAYRGHLRVEPGYAASGPEEGWIRSFDEKLVLATLNGPKPEQFRFYLGNKNGNALNPTDDNQAGVEKSPENGYPAKSGEVVGRRLRGRKVYLTHTDVLRAEGYWDPSEARPSHIEVNGSKRYREYQALEDPKEKVSTSIRQWVNPKVEFRFTIRVDNLSRTELGALLWLLNLPPIEGRPAYHKLGLGKPLGFGVVEVTADLSQARLYAGDTLHRRYRTLSAKPDIEPKESLTDLLEVYKGLLKKHLKEVSREFLRAAAGYPGFPVHYPRSNPVPDKNHPSYEWFVHNDQAGSKKEADHGRRLALPKLGQAPALPYDPTGTNGTFSQQQSHQQQSHRQPPRSQEVQQNQQQPERPKPKPPRGQQPRRKG